MASVIIACKALVRFVAKSKPASIFLQSNQVINNEPIRKLVQEAQTRWNSLLELLESIACCRKSVLALLDLAFCPPKVKTLARHLSAGGLVDGLIEILQPIRIATLLLQAEHVPTIHHVIPTIVWLKKELQTLLASSPSLGAFSSLIVPLVTNLDLQFIFSKESAPAELMGIALDPSNNLRSAEDPRRTFVELGFELLEAYYLKNLREFPPEEPTLIPTSNTADLHVLPWMADFEPSDQANPFSPGDTFLAELTAFKSMRP